MACDTRRLQDWQENDTWRYLAYLLPHMILLSLRQWFFVVLDSDITRIVIVWWVQPVRRIARMIYLTIVQLQNVLLTIALLENVLLLDSDLDLQHSYIP